MIRTRRPSSPRCVGTAVSSPELRLPSSSSIESTKVKSRHERLRIRRGRDRHVVDRRQCSPPRDFCGKQRSASLILFARKRTNHLVPVELLGFLRPSQSFSDVFAARHHARPSHPGVSMPGPLLTDISRCQIDICRSDISYTDRLMYFSMARHLSALLAKLAYATTIYHQKPASGSNQDHRRKMRGGQSEDWADFG